MRRTCLNLPRAVGVASCIALAALTASAAALPATASADHRHGSTKWWETDSDAGSWTGAGAGWNGGSSSKTTTTWTPEETKQVDVRDLVVDRAAISPNDDDQGDAATVSFRLRSTSAFVTVRVVDAAGTIVRQLGELRKVRVTGDFTWDGRNDAGAIVPDGAYRVVLAPIVENSTTARHDEAAPSPEAAADPLALDVTVDTAVPDVTASRPTLVQLRALARRAGELRDAKARWATRANKHGTRRGTGRHNQGHGNKGGNGNHYGWSRNEREWVELWMERQLRLPMTFTTGEAGEVSITAQVGDEERTFETYRDAGRHSVDVVLPDYAAGARASITFASGDDAGNVRRHTVVVRLPALPAPKVTKRNAGDGDRGSSSTGSGGGSAAPVSGVPTSGGGPFPDWLDPIMLRATYGAGVPQSWAKSQALANLVFRESSYRPTAQNPTSTAYGLFQFVDQTWATVGCTKTSDAYQQSVCGLRYVQRRYHTPEAAWRFWQANHWY